MTAVNTTMAEANSGALLLTSLRDFLRESFVGWQFPSPQRGEVEPTIYLHGMPDDGTLDLYPFLLVRWMSREMRSDLDHKTVLEDEVGIVCGVHSPDSQEQAGMLLADMIDRVCWCLWSERLLVSRFELVEPPRAMIPDPELKVHRYHMATVVTRWQYTWPPKALKELTPHTLGNYTIGE